MATPTIDISLVPFVSISFMRSTVPGCNKILLGGVWYDEFPDKIEIAGQELRYDGTDEDDDSKIVHYIQ